MIMNDDQNKTDQRAMDGLFVRSMDGIIGKTIRTYLFPALASGGIVWLSAQIGGHGDQIANRLDALERVVGGLTTQVSNQVAAINNVVTAVNNHTQQQEDRNIAVDIKLNKFSTDIDTINRELRSLHEASVHPGAFKPTDPETR